MRALRLVGGESRRLLPGRRVEASPMRRSAGVHHRQVGLLSHGESSEYKLGSAVPRGHLRLSSRSPTAAGAVEARGTTNLAANEESGVRRRWPAQGEQGFPAGTAAVATRGTDHQASWRGEALEAGFDDARCGRPGRTRLGWPGGWRALARARAPLSQPGHSAGRGQQGVCSQSCACGPG